MTACLPADLWLTRGRQLRNSPGPAVSLTFDDGPHPEYTPQALERLRRYGWRGTFFLVGERAAAHPDLVRRIVEDGHEVGNHSYTHSEPAETSVRKLLDEVRATRQLLEEIAGRPVTLMRPPRGNVTLSKLLGLWREQQTVVLWSVDPKDYRPGRDAELERWTADYTPHHGDIVLFHDNRPRIAGILDGLWEHQRLHGMQTVGLSAWLS